MPQPHTYRSKGPFSWHRPNPNAGYTTIHDCNGRMIGAATACPAAGATPLNEEAIAANGLMFAASHSLCVALASYMNAVDRAVVGQEGFSEEIIEALTEARQEALDAFDVLFGKKGALA